MAIPVPEDKCKEKLYNLINQLEVEFRWCCQHPNDVSKNELDQLMQAVEDLEKHAHHFKGQIYSDYAKFKKEFKEFIKKPEEIKPGDFQRFEDMIQKLFKDLE